MKTSANRLQKIAGVFIIGVIALDAVLKSTLLFARPAWATVVTDPKDTMTRQKISTSSSHTISFTLSGSETFASTETITLDFHEDDSGFTVDGSSTTASDFDFNDGTERTIVASGACSGSPQNEVQFAVNDSTGVVTLTACSGYTASGAGATITIEYGSSASGGTDRVTNPASAKSQTINMAGTFGDDAFTIAVPIVDDDQVSITASVDAYIDFDIDVADGHGDSDDPYTVALGVLSYASITQETTSGIPEIYVDLSTNADGGVLVQVKSANGATGLSSSSTGDNIPSSTTTLTTSTTDGGYGLAADENAAATEGILQAVTPFNVWSTSGGIGGLTTSFQTILNTNSAPVVDGNGKIAVRATAGKSTSSAYDYSDTLTFVAIPTY